MITINSNKDLLKYLDKKSDTIIIYDDIEIDFDGFCTQHSLECKNIVSKDYARNISVLDISALDISAWNISAGNISAGNISAGNISASDISARNISARNISAWNISAWNISAGDISAGDILAGNIWADNISAWDISARDIIYYADCFAYSSIKCNSIKEKEKKIKTFLFRRKNNKKETGRELI